MIGYTRETEKLMKFFKDCDIEAFVCKHSKGFD